MNREWLETNGIGGFASSTESGMNTRRYHGLLVAALHPPVGRMALLSKLEETLIVEGRRVELGQLVGAPVGVALVDPAARGARRRRAGAAQAARRRLNGVHELVREAQ